MKRPSLQNRAVKTNGFFDHFQPEIWNALVDDAAAMEAHLRRFYVPQRRHTASASEIDAILSRIPEELRALYQSPDGARSEPSYADDSLRIGFYELDLLDFLLNIRSNRVLNLIGSVGVGKTTFLTYVLQEVRRNTTALRRFIPITVSFTKYPKRTLREADLFQMVLLKTLDALQGDASWRPDAVARTLMAKHGRLTAFGADARRSALVELIGAIRSVFSEGGDLEPVFVFDNLDQLDGDSVSSVSTFARALFLETRLAVILAMRPPAFSTHGENDAHKGAFQTFWIELSPPDLGLLFCRRLSQVLRPEPVTIEIEGRPISISLPNVQTAIANVAQNVLTPENQRLLLEGIANNNVRKAGRAFVNILRYRELRPDLLFSVASPAQSRELPGGFHERLLDGMMLGPSILYRDTYEGRPVVSNIFHFGCPDGPPDYLIQYRVLALLDWAVKVVEIDQLVEWLRTLGYDRRQIVLCVEHMLRRGLVYSPESEYEFDEVRHIGQSASGSYYLTELCSHRQYLWHAIPDIPLEHVYFSTGEEKGFVGRFTSILEYLDRVAALEQIQINAVAETRHAATLIGTLERSKLLQRRVISAARGIVRSAGHSTHDAVRTAGIELGEQLDKAEARTREIERRVDQLLIGGKLALPELKRHVVEIPYEWAQRHRVALHVPCVLCAADPNEVRIECRLDGTSHAGTLFGRLECLGTERRFDEMTELHPSGTTRVFRGTFSLPWSGEAGMLPDFRLSLFAESRPILRKVFRSPGRT